MFKETERGPFERNHWLSLMVVCALWTVLASGMAFGQDAGSPPPLNGQPGGPADGMGPPPMEHRRPPMERAFHMGPRGRWWNDPEFVKLLGLTADQQKKMEDVFEQSRAKLMDLSSQVRAEEEKMVPLLEVNQPEEAKVLGEIDRIAQVRAELEKANARMLLGLRRVLTQDQWQKLQANDPGRHGHWNHDAGPGMN